MNPRQKGNVLANPNVVPNDGITLIRQILLRREILLPTIEDIERVRGSGIHRMIGPVHDKFHTSTNLAELANNQFIANKVIMMGDVPLEILTIKIGVFAHLDVGAIN